MYVTDSRGILIMYEIIALLIIGGGTIYGIKKLLDE